MAHKMFSVVDFGFVHIDFSELYFGFVCSELCLIAADLIPKGQGGLVTLGSHFRIPV